MQNCWGCIQINLNIVLCSCILGMENYLETDEDGKAICLESEDAPCVKFNVEETKKAEEIISKKIQGKKL